MCVRWLNSDEIEVRLDQCHDSWGLDLSHNPMQLVGKWIITPPQANESHANEKFVLEKLKSLCRKAFSEDISHLVFSCDESNIEFFLKHFFMYIVVVDFNVFITKM